jgi:hypothetical protein
MNSKTLDHSIIRIKSINTKKDYIEYEIKLYKNMVLITNLESKTPVIDNSNYNYIIIEYINRLYDNCNNLESNFIKQHIEFIYNILKILIKTNKEIFYQLLVSNNKEVREIAKLHLTSQS